MSATEMEGNGKVSARSRSSTIELQQARIHARYICGVKGTMRMAGVKGPRPCLGLLGKGDRPLRVLCTGAHTRTQATHALNTQAEINSWLTQPTVLRSRSRYFQRNQTSQQSSGGNSTCVIIRPIRRFFIPRSVCHFFITPSRDGLLLPPLSVE